MYFEKQARSQEMDDIIAMINARKERDNIGVRNGKWTTQENKSGDWNLCWHFNSKSGCRKGANCKWIHSAQEKPQYFGATGLEFGYGGFGQQPGMGMQWLPHYGPMGALGLNFAPKPAESALNIAAKSFSPSVWSKEFAPTKDTFYPGLTMKGKNVHAKEFSPVGKGILSQFGEGVPLSGSEKGDNVEAEEFFPGDGKSSYSLDSINSGKSQVEQDQHESQTVNRAPKKSTEESQEPTSDIVIPNLLKNTGENNPQNTTDKADGESVALNNICESKSQTDEANGASTMNSICEKKSENITDGTNEANVAAPELSKTRSPGFRLHKSYGNWADAFSPLTTPVFQKLPMPRIKMLSPSIMSGGRNKTETPNLKDKSAQAIEISSPKWSKSNETLKQIRKQMKNSSIAQVRAAAELKPVSNEWLPHLNDIPEQFSPWMERSSGRNGVNISNPTPSTVLRNTRLRMMDPFIKKHILKLAKSHSKSQNLESGKKATIHKSFDVRDIDSSQDSGLITKNSTIGKTSVVDIVAHPSGDTDGLIANQESIPFPSERHNKTTGELDRKNSKTPLQVKENLVQSSDSTSTQVKALPATTSTPASSSVFSPPIPAPAVVPQQGSHRRSYGSRGKGKMGNKYRMNSKQFGRGRGTKDGQERSNENQIQSKVSRFPKRGEDSNGGKSIRGRRQ